MPEPRKCQYCDVELEYGRCDHVRRGGGYVCVGCFSATTSERRRRREAVLEGRRIGLPPEARRLASSGSVQVADRIEPKVEVQVKDQSDGRVSVAQGSPGSVTPKARAYKPSRELTQEEFDKMFFGDDDP
jgi:hypothetical protein